MTLRQDNLRGLFERAGMRTAGGRPKITTDLLAAGGLLDESKRVYRALGGSLDIPVLGPPPSGPGKWDVVVESVPVELDEERHFNRYRGITLLSIIYDVVTSFDATAYRTFCVDREPDCLSAAGWRGNWSNRSCEYQFGAAPPEALLQEPGPPGWKQRAMKDFLKDAFWVVDAHPTVRFSIWEKIDTGNGYDLLGRLLSADASGHWRDEVIRQFHQRMKKVPE